MRKQALISSFSDFPDIVVMGAAICRESVTRGREPADIPFLNCDDL